MSCIDFAPYSRSGVDKTKNDPEWHLTVTRGGLSGIHLYQPRRVDWLRCGGILFFVARINNEFHMEKRTSRFQHI